MAKNAGKKNGGGLGRTGRNNGLSVIPKPRPIKSGGGDSIATGKIFSAPKKQGK